MKQTSIIKLALFLFALYANIRYVSFILNPIHADNIVLFSLTAFADVLAIIILSSTWATALFYELFKDRYYKEIESFSEKAKYNKLLEKPVAVLIPVVNEDIRIVEQTIDSAINLIGKKRIIILDDGKQKNMKALCQRKNSKAIPVEYITRLDRLFFKAGNLNNGLKYVTEDFVVVVDADFQLHKNFLVRTLPMFENKKIGAVQTPQVYYNEDTLFARGSLNLQTIFYTYILPAKTLLDSAFCVGTNVIYRKEALDTIGGVALVDHSEDVFTSLVMLEHGYVVFYLNEELAFGLAPSTLISFFNQQFRWARGGLSMLFKHNTLFNKELTTDQRVQFFLSNLFYLSGVSVLIYLVCPLIAVILSVKPINDAYFSTWLIDYLLYLASNMIFYMTLTKKNRFETLILGIFSFIPYIAALVSVFFTNKFNWKPTNAVSGDLITKILLPAILYIVTAFALFYKMLISTNPNLTPYYLWIGVDTLLFVRLLFAGYLAKPLEFIEK